MTALEKANELRQQAIQTLLDERAAIDKLLDTLGCEKEAPAKRRGRPKKAEVTNEQPESVEPTPQLSRL